LDDKFQHEVERILAQLRSLKKSLADESDPDEQKRTMKLLKNARRKLTAHRESLEALRANPYAGSELEEQIQLIGMLEDECRTDNGDERLV
jgi:signal transduction histidine kinase